MTKARWLTSHLLWIALLAAAPGALAKPTTFEIDPVHSRVGFSIRHIFTKVPGNFTRHSGALTFDAEQPSNSSVKVEIETASINTGNERRDGHLKSADFFDAAKHPALTFVSSKVTDRGEGKLTVEGTLTMHGITKPVVLDAAYLGSGPGPDGALRAGFEATGKVNRKDFGITWNKALDQGGTLLGDEVEIRLDVEAVVKAPSEEKAEGAAAGAKGAAASAKGAAAGAKGAAASAKGAAK